MAMYFGESTENVYRWAIRVPITRDLQRGSQLPVISMSPEMVPMGVSHPGSTSRSAGRTMSGANA